ncbi:sensor domain-containing diguanylate cyclase [Sulfurimonas sp.]|nr:sensor domain-containing diguanylate cyclase [Sulfurimonas sp.]
MVSFFKNMFNNTPDYITSENLSSLAFLQSPIAMVLTDENGTIFQINHAFTQLTGYTQSDVIDENMSLLKSGEYTHAFYRSFYEKLLKTKKHKLEIYNRCKNGELMLMSESISHITSNESHYCIVTLEDITEQKRLSERYQYLATHDPLTGLANRTLFEDRFSHATLNAARSRKKLAILMCDLNEFKQINDTFGHNFGDLVLQQTAQRLKTAVRSSDTIARYGGDEFILILENLEDVHEIDTIVNSCKASFPMSLDINNGKCEIGISIGYACFPEEGTTLEQLTSQADTKMYKEKDYFYGIG